MQATVIGARYAKALLNLAGKDKIESVGTEIQGFAYLYQESPKFQEMIANPKSSRSNKVDEIAKLAKKLGFSETTTTFSRYLASKGRFNLIESVAIAYDRLAMEALNQARATITVADEISQDEVAKLQKELSELTKKKVSLEVEVDPSILGGAITQIGSLVLDGSIKNKLNLIRETISRGN